MISKDYYELLGTNKQGVEIEYKTNRSRSPEDQDIFIREKYEHTKKVINMKKQIAKEQERYRDLENLENLEKKVEIAYKKLETPILREIYNKEMEDKKSQKIIPEIPKDRTAYKVLDVSISSLQYRTDEEIDILLAKRKDALLRVCEISVTPRTTFVESQRIELERQKILESYELIKTADRRAKYDEQLRIKEEERKRKNEVERIKQTYSHASEYDEKAIQNIETNSGEVKKAIVRKAIENPEEYFLEDEENRNLRLKKTADIVYMGRSIKGLLQEYEVKREINGEEKINTVYTEIIRFDLSIDKKTGDKINPGYYDCVANDLLSEEAIEGAKYNGGYIGRAEKNKNGEYYLTVREKRLVGIEQEMLTVAMILAAEKNKANQEKGEEECQR